MSRRALGIALVVLLAAGAYAARREAGAAAAPRAGPSGGLDVREVTLASVIGEVDGAPLRAGELDARSLAALRALWQALHETKREALARRLGAPPESPEVARHVPALAADRETPWPARVARAGAAEILDAELEAAARLRLARLRARAHAELARGFEAAADARRLELRAQRLGTTAAALVARAHAAAPTVSEADVEAYLRAHPELAASGRPERVRVYLEGRGRAEAELALRDALRAETPAVFAVRAPEAPRLDAPGAQPGPGDPPAVLLAYTALRCRHCAQAERVLAELESGPWRESVRIERRAHFPAALLPALEDAVAERCAAAQGRGAELRRDVLAALGTGGAADAAAIAGAIVPDAGALARCLRDPAVREAVLRERAQAEALGFEETPSFLVNGIPLVGLHSREEIETVLREALGARAAGAPGTPTGESS